MGYKPRLFQGVCKLLAFVLVCLQFAPAWAIETPACNYSSGNSLSLAHEFKAAMETDPFADAFTIYIEDIAAEEQAMREWETKANTLKWNECLPLNTDVENYLDHYEAVKEECTGTFPEPKYSSCVNKRQVVENERIPLQSRMDTYDQKRLRLEAEGAVIVNRLLPALQRAEDYLNPANTTLVVRAYADKLVRQRNITSCAAFVKIAAALSKRVNDYRFFAEHINLALAADRNPMVNSSRNSTFDTRFDDSGFKEEFKDSSDQVRHATVYFVFGARYSGPAAGLFAKFREIDQKKDRDLGIVAGHLGWQLSLGLVGLNDIAGEMNSRFCAN